LPFCFITTPPSHINFDLIRLLWILQVNYVLVMLLYTASVLIVVSMVNVALSAVFHSLREHLFLIEFLFLVFLRALEEGCGAIIWGSLMLANICTVVLDV
jgi:hypothetical protein